MKTKLLDVANLISQK